MCILIQKRFLIKKYTSVSAIQHNIVKLFLLATNRYTTITADNTFSVRGTAHPLKLVQVIMPHSI